MRSRWTSASAVSLLSAAALACGDSTGPLPQDLVDVVLDFCAAETPVFFAVQNPGSNWERVMPDGQGTFTFKAAPAVGIAFVHQNGSEFSTEYVFTTPADLEPLSGVSCIEQTGTKTLNGSVAGVPVGSATMASMAGSFAYVAPPTTTFSIPELPPGTIDLIAHREVVGTSAVMPDRVIIRRAQDRTSGSTLPVLDFSAAEAQTSASHGFTAAGLSTSENTEYLLTFSTPTTRRHSLSVQTAVGSGLQTIFGIPGALTQSGDFHELDVFADGGTTYRGEVQFYRVPSSRAVTLGANLNNPTLTTVSGGTHLRLRTQLPSQLEYGALVSVAHAQPSRLVVLTATNSYLGGTPVVWDLTIPDLSGMPGFPAGALLQSGAGTDWFVDAYGGTGAAAAFFGAPTDGAVLHYAGRAFETSARQFSRSPAAERHAPLTRRRGLGDH